MDLPPKLAALAADSTYQLRLANQTFAAAAVMGEGTQSFDVVRGTMLRGTTGMGPVSSNTGFGFVAKGRGSHEGEVLIAVRGTEMTSHHDWLTNLRLAGVRGPGGHTVHRGFWMLASGILDQVNAALDNLSPTEIHVTGHSLGGATATLLADAIRAQSGRQNVKLYTFGAPRAGVEAHSRHLTASLGAENIFRAYHHSDPVPMVPVFPYAHVPFEDKAYLMTGPGSLISVAAHSMGEYIRSVGTSNWNGINVGDTSFESFEAAESWLDQTASSGGAMMSATALRMIMSALGWILKKIGHLAGYAVLGGASIIDYIARLLYEGVLINIQIGVMVGQMIAAILRFTGRTVASGANMTVAFFQYVLDLMFRTVSTVAIRAIDAVR